MRSGFEAHLEEEHWSEPTPPHTTIEDNIETVLVALSADHIIDKEWILDSGVSRHFANNANLFANLDNTPIGTVRSAIG